MKLYVGSRDYKPEGFLTVDIDEQMKPDIVADITETLPVDANSCSEVVASHVLEHLEWPDSFKTLSEFARILRPNGTLRLAVPDMSLLVRMLLNGGMDFHAVGLLYGMGGRENPFEAHRYGFTAGMLVDILDVLGFGEYDWWNSDVPDASNGWIPARDEKRVAMSLNIKATKLRDPVVDAAKLFELIARDPMQDILVLAARLGDETELGLSRSVTPELHQRTHLKLIEARQRIKYLEGLIGR
jgi:predicted SAM-dependent methyltransferase